MNFPERVAITSSLLDKLEEETDKIASSLNTKNTFSKNSSLFAYTRLPIENEVEQVNPNLSEKYAQESLDLLDSLRDIRYKEGSEKMVDLGLLLDSAGAQYVFSRKPFHSSCGEYGNKDRVFWVRETVAKLFTNYSLALNTIGIKAKVEDAFRPIGVQEGLLKRRLKMVLEEKPGLQNETERLLKEVRSMTAVYPALAGHKSGAAIDMTLYNLDNSPLDLGNYYPEGGAKVALKYPYVTEGIWYTRQLFLHSATMAGFSVYPYEDWHINYGDLSSAIQYKDGQFIKDGSVEIKYGPIKSFDSNTGEVLAYGENEYYEPMSEIF